MKIKIQKSNRMYDKNDINIIEELMGCGVPHDYIDFLKLYNGGEPTTANIFKIPNAHTDGDINTFLDIQEVLLLIEQKMKERFPDKVIPIAYDSCGNYICISLEEGKNGIYFWDHELEADEGEPPTWDNMFFVSDSFSDFLEMVEEFDLDKYR